VPSPPANDVLLLAVSQLHGLLRRERGQALAEYGLVVALIAVGVVVPTVIIFRDALADVFATVGTCLAEGCGG